MAGGVREGKRIQSVEGQRGAGCTAAGRRATAILPASRELPRLPLLPSSALSSLVGPLPPIILHLQTTNSTSSARPHLLGALPFAPPVLL